MARIQITVWTTLHGTVTIDQAFDETIISDYILCEPGPREQTTCVANAIKRAGASAAAAHGEPLSWP